MTPAQRIEDRVFAEEDFRDQDWDLLIRDIFKGNVVPVVGPDLLINGADSARTLHQHLTATLIQEYNIDPEKLPSPCSFMDICGYVDSGNRDVQDTILNAMANWPAPEPLRQLAEISGFDLYVSTTFDSLLYEALARSRGPAEARTYDLNIKTEDVDIAVGRLAAPVVFQIFGLMDTAASCALSEEDVLEFTQRLQNPSYRPERIFSLLAKRNLLFLGCGFPGWLGRFLRRLLKANGKLVDRGFFAHSSVHSDRGYVNFLERQGAKLWLRDSGGDFVRELHRRWMLAHPPGEHAHVFISYAKQDVDDARVLTSLFTESGISVWFDRNNLRAGEIWRKEIEDAVTSSPVFVPLVSRNTERAGPERYIHEEWRRAAGMPDRRICPMQLDDTDLPASFEGRQSRTFRERQQLVEDVKAFLRQGGLV